MSTAPLIVERSSEVPSDSTSPSGARSGALLAAASLLAIVLNYAFLLAAGRLLGKEDYGALAALLGLLTVVLVPTSALQMAVSRDIARHLAGGDDGEASAFARATVRVSVIAAAPVVAAVLLLAVPLGDLLDIDPVLVLLAAAGLLTAFAFPAALGVLQGYQRFHALAAMQVVPFALRLTVLAVLAAVGYKLGGAVLAIVLGLLLSSVVALFLVRTVVRRGAARPRPAVRLFLRYLVPVAVGLVGITMLTNLDVLVVRARFPADDAGVYAAASAFARVAFFLPAAVLAVLFPRTAARQARGEPTGDILGRALIATAAFCGLLVVAYALAGEGLLATSFGLEFGEGGALLPEYALAISLYSLANVLVGYHLSRGEHRYAWIVAGAVLVQIAVLAFVPNTIEGVIWTNLALAAGLLAAHELFVESSIPALREGARQLVSPGVAATTRRVAREGVIALGGYAVLAVLITWPLAAHLGSTFIGDERNDAAGTIAWLWRLGEEGGYHVFGTAEHTLTGAPLGWEQGNALNVQWLLPLYPAFLVSEVAGEVVAYNLVILGGLTLSALAMYALARYLGCRPVVAAWAGVAFMLLPWLVWRVNAGHAALVHAWVLPTALLTLAAWSMRPTALRAALVGLAAAAAWLTYGYFGVMVGIGGLAFVLGAGVARRSTRGARTAIRQALYPVAAIVGATFAVFVLTIPGRAEGGATIPRDVFSLSAYGARPVEYLLPPERHPLLGSLFDSVRPGLHDSNVAETTLYVGWLTIALAIVGFVAVARRRTTFGGPQRAAVAGLGAVAVGAFVFSLPSPISLGSLDFTWTPSWFVFQALNEFRVPSRFAALVAAALIPVAALGLQALYDRIRATAPAVGLGSRRAALVTLIVIGLTAFDLSPTLGTPITGDSRASAYRAVEGTDRGVLAEYPAGPAGVNVALEQLLYQRGHGRALVNGARERSDADDMRLAVVDPTAPGAAEVLALLGVTSVVTRGDALAYERGIPDGPPAELGDGFELAGSFADAYRVWRVTALAAPALVTLPSADWEQPLPSGGLVETRKLRGEDGIIELRARAASRVLLSFAVAPSSSPLGSFRLAGGSGSERLEVSGGVASIPIELPRGRSQVRLVASNGAEIRISAPRAAGTERAPLVRAELVSSDPGF